MKDFYVRTSAVWVRVSRRADKSFEFAIGHIGNVKAFNVCSYPHQFMPTIADAKVMAKNKAETYA